MGINYASKKCPSCGSTKFNYIKETKLWECLYCGTTIERQEQQDSLFTIKNVVRQVLVDVSYQRFADAKTNLTECEKIDTRYVGTTIARICYFLNAALFAGVSQQEQRNYFAQLKKCYQDLCAFGDAPEDEEMILYEFLDSAEAYGTLILAYDTLNCPKRIEAIYDLFKPEEVYSMSLNANLLKYMVNHQKYEFADRIVGNCDNLDKRPALLFLLDKYPDGEQKVANCSLLLSRDVLAPDERHVIESYLQNSADSVSTKYQIACAALRTAAAPSIRCLMDTVITKIGEAEDVKSIFDIILSRKLVDSEIYTIVEYAFGKCSQEVILYIVTLFRDTAQFVVLNQRHFVILLENREVSYDYKKKIIDIAIQFNVSEKAKEQVVAYYLNNVADEFEKRDDFIRYLFSLVPSISTVSAEKYILSVNIDGENKPTVVRYIFALDINRAFFRETFDKYIASGCDAPQVTEQITAILSEAGLRLSENAFAQMLVRPTVSEAMKLNLLRQLRSSGVKYLSLLDKYLMYVPAESYSGYVMQELTEYTDTVSYDAVVRYLLSVSDRQTSKPATVVRLLEKCKLPVLTQSCRINHLNTAVECTVLQAYILNTPDPSDLTCAVLSSVGAGNCKLNTEILAGDARKKFKKYLSGAKPYLSSASAAAANMLGLM